MDWEKEINNIFDNAYSEDLPLSPKHTIFRRGKALNEILSLIHQHQKIKLPENPFWAGDTRKGWFEALQQVKETLEKLGFEVEE